MSMEEKKIVIILVFLIILILANILAKIGLDKTVKKIKGGKE